VSNIGEYGIKIRNIKAATLYGYNKGFRNRYDYTDAMLNNSLFSIYLSKNGMNVYKGESTRDVICLEFDFGSRSYDEEIDRLYKLLADNKYHKLKDKIQNTITRVEVNKNLYDKKSKEEIREEFYQNGVSVEYNTYDKNNQIKTSSTIKYKMLYRTPSKAKVGQVMFINEKLYKKAYDWLTIGLGNKMPKENAKIVEMSAYAPLTTSTIIDTLHIPVEDILILKDQDSFFKTTAKIVLAEDYYKTKKVIDEEKTEENKQKAINKGNFDDDGNPIYRKSYKKSKIPDKKCVVKSDEIEVKNTIWDGMGIIDDSILPEYINGMALLRHHLFKMCGFRGMIQLFFKDWCNANGYDYETYEIVDMFGLPHKLKDIKVITTNNAIKWLKFKELMGNSNLEAYQYWCDKVNADGSCFGIVKTDHSSKLGDIQQMSYQMINTIPCELNDVAKIAKTSIDYIELLKQDNDEFERFLRKNANEINHYEMMADLYNHNHEFANSKWFRYEKKEIIKGYVYKLRKGKIAINADNLTICGNPYALLLYSVGDNWANDPTLNHENGTIQCYTTRFDHDEYLCAIRNPHNSPNNICYLHNIHSELMKKYFRFSDNIIAVNCIKSDIQDRANGMDEDSDFFYVTNQPTMVKYSKICYEQYPTIVNKLKESNITYSNTKLAYAEMDNKFAMSQMSIGESSNLAQLAMTYYWTNFDNKELYDNFVILSVIAQVAIDSCKREYEVDPVSEIERIKKMECMKITRPDFIDGEIVDVRSDFPEFMKYTKEIKHTKNGKELPYEEVREKKEKIKKRINNTLVCPMNYLQEILDKIQMSENSNTIPTEKFFIKMSGKPKNEQMTKIRNLVEQYDKQIREIFILYNDDELMYFLKIKEATRSFIDNLHRIKVGNIVTINRLIEIALGLEKNNGNYKRSDDNLKHSRKILNALYKMNKDKFLINFE
jgi:hypothetical protein